VQETPYERHLREQRERINNLQNQYAQRTFYQQPQPQQVPQQYMQPQAPNYQQQQMRQQMPMQQQPQVYGNPSAVTYKQIELMPSNWYSIPSILQNMEPEDHFRTNSAAATVARGALFGALTSLAHYISFVPWIKK